MLKLFRSDHLAKAYKAIETDNLDKLSNLLKKLPEGEINKPVSDSTPSLVEACIIKQSPKALRLVLEHGASTDQATDLYTLSLQQDKSLPLLTHLLHFGKEYDSQKLLAACFNHCKPSELMLHISLLLQSGAHIDEQSIHSALSTEDLALVNFIFSSGAALPENLNEKDYKAEIIAYAEKCVADLKIRQMFLN